MRVSLPEPAMVETPVKVRPATMPVCVPSMVQVLVPVASVRVLTAVGSTASDVTSVAVRPAKSAAEPVPVSVVPFHVQELAPLSIGIDTELVPPPGANVTGTVIAPPEMSIVRLVSWASELWMSTPVRPAIGVVPTMTPFSVRLR